MIVIGIDPGLATVGFGVIRTENRNITPISYGCIKTSPDKQTPQRLLDIFNEITSLFEKYKPEVIAVETLFFSKNVTNGSVSYTHLRAHETRHDLVCRLLLEKKKENIKHKKKKTRKKNEKQKQIKTQK